ncbi:MAG: SUMF1/EgtB/PvdO family nonheme iron enzyme [Fibrobacter sp.]|jgi:hypothetical protein|nr:SUMF1/EgtB/PvdO family nonheme iron enzyme [Fibrobacter sp.]
MTPKNTNPPKKNKRKYIPLILMLLCLAVLFIFQCQLRSIKENATVPEEPAVLPDTSAIQTPDTIAVPEAESSSGEILLSSSSALAPKPKVTTASSSATLPPPPLSSASNDFTPPAGTLAPPPGRYYEPISLTVKCDEIKCKSFISFEDTLSPQELSAAIEYNKTGSVFFRVQDSAGNLSKWESGHYDMASDNVCGKNAYPVPVGTKTICVDAYEYPNLEGELPKDMVSQAEAVRLCEQAGKRLCSLNEWQAACRGKDKFNYSYGNSYRGANCNTQSNQAQRAGRKEQCRSWFGMNDMNGNLWEWTSTPSKERNTLFLVAGGAWNTQNASSCTENKFSFYPQNEYPFVGFRCCADAP